MVSEDDLQSELMEVRKLKEQYKEKLQKLQSKPQPKDMSDYEMDIIIRTKAKEIFDKEKEEERLLREYEEREELERQKELQQKIEKEEADKIEKEEADKIEKEEVDKIEKEEVDKIEKARLKKLAICPYCNKQVISKKQLKDEVSVTCPQCGGEVELCGLCDKIVKHPHLADDCEWRKAFKR